MSKTPAIDVQAIADTVGAKAAEIPTEVVGDPPLVVIIVAVVFAIGFFNLFMGYIYEGITDADYPAQQWILFGPFIIFDHVGRKMFCD